MFHGDTCHTGEVTGSPIDSGNVAELRLIHDVKIPGPILSVPAIVEGKVYVGLANASGTPGATGGQMLKIDAATGQIEAEFCWHLGPNEGDSHGFMGMGCTPAIAGDRIYFFAFNAKLYCLDRHSLQLVWVTDLRNPDAAHGQPVSNTLLFNAGDPNAAGWSSPVVANGKIYVGTGEGENPALFGFVFCLDAASGNVDWIYCTVQLQTNIPNQPNHLPACVIPGFLPPKFTVDASIPAPSVRGCSVWSCIAYDPELNRIYCTTGNPAPDGNLPTPGFSNGILSLDASTGDFKGFFQASPDSSYRPSDVDVDFGGSPMVFTLNGRRVVAAGCKNGGFFVLDAKTMKLVNQRQLLPYYNDGTQIPTVDPHVPATNNDLDVWVPNEVSNSVQQENFYGTYSTPAIHSGLRRIFMGIGGNNYHNVAAGIDSTTTPFMRVMDWETLDDAWPMDQSNPRRYTKPQPPMYAVPGESGLSSPAVVNDVVFCSTSIIGLYAFSAHDGTLLWQHQLGEQTGGMNGGYGYCLGPAIEGRYVVAGGLVFGRNGGVLHIYSL
jgi:outer membrane protein assembly factor BamB